eukprot:TRINITY_DN4403_c0_g4_i1.p1 TRINITY_DN4403_c0_g4~~TRINITY_DN4403_c0_g4_i1.p1  ORF type:complete len:672 (-),score=126.31 TRINITY_DN4403_c0_g4_i1:196-2211(-)
MAARAFPRRRVVSTLRSIHDLPASRPNLSRPPKLYQSLVMGTRVLLPSRHLSSSPISRPLLCGLTTMQRSNEAGITRECQRSLRSYQTSTPPSASLQHQQQSESDMNELSITLSRVCPGFRVHGDRIAVLSSPDQFYDKLLDGITTAQDRIVLSSLYLGTGPKCKQLLDRLNASLAEKPNLKVSVLLDHLRGQREDPSSLSSSRMLLPLVSKFPDRVSVHLYHTSLLNGWKKSWLPQRANEIFGVQHVKVYAFDNSLMLSGANLSEDYFTNRQDRYMVFDACDDITNHYVGIVDAVSSFSYRMQSDTTTASPEATNSASTAAASSPSSQSSDTYSLLPPAIGVEPFGPGSEAFSKLAAQQLNPYVTPHSTTTTTTTTSSSSSTTTSSSSSSSLPPDTWVFPTLQMGPSGVRQDERVVSFLMKWWRRGTGTASSSNTNYHLYVSSPYFNIADGYTNGSLLASQSAKAQENSSGDTLDILTASPRANGFYGSKGASGAIPALYSRIEERFAKAATETLGLRFGLHEYFREGWTFHSKGMWFSMTPKTADAAAEAEAEAPTGHDSNPCLTVIGSSNFGVRSMERDIEAQAVILTDNAALQASLRDERNFLFTAVPLEDQSPPTEVIEGASLTAPLRPAEKTRAVDYESFPFDPTRKIKPKWMNMLPAAWVEPFL